MFYVKKWPFNPRNLSVTRFLGSNAHFFMKYTHFFSPWVDFLFSSDYSEPFETNLDQFWLFRTISRPFLANLGCFLTCFWGKIPIFSWSTSTFSLLEWILYLIKNILNLLGPTWTNFDYLEPFLDHFQPIWDVFWCISGVK